MSLVTVNNLYENGVCDEFTIYTGTTYNGDPYIIPSSAQSIGLHSLPHTFNVGTYEGPLYIFLVHCDFYVTPPPSETPKRQGGFQVKLINIDCENCPPFSPVATPSPTSTPTATPTTDCNFTVNFVEYSPSLSPSPSPSPSPTPSVTTSPTPTPTEGPCVCIEFSHNSSGTRYYGYDDCSGVPQTGTTYTQETFSVCGSGQNITVSDPKLSYSIGSDCVGGICPSPNPTPTPTVTPDATPQPTPNATPAPTPQPTDVGGPPQFSDAQIQKSVCITDTNTVTQIGTVTLTEATEFRVIAEAYTEDEEEDYLMKPEFVIGTTNIQVEAQMGYEDGDTVEVIGSWVTIQPGTYSYQWEVATHGITGNGCGYLEHRSA